MKSSEKIVLDAWAILALILKEEPAAGIVKEIFVQAQRNKQSVFSSWVNVGEVYYSIGKRKSIQEADEVIEMLQLLPITIEVPSQSDILKAAGLKALHKLSYADAFAVSLALKIDGVIYTGDPEIISLKEVVKVNQLSRSKKVSQSNTVYL